MRKIALLIVMSMMLSMSACGKGNEVQNKNENKTENKTESNKETVEENTDNKDDMVVDNSGDESEDAKNQGDKDGSIGQVLLADFKEKVKDTTDPQALADEILKNEVIKFKGATMAVEQGPLNGFDSDIKGFKKGVMFSPMIGTIPFVGYIFTVDKEDDVDKFVETLEKNANPRWNICTEAEETVVEAEGNTVFFLMCPSKFEE